jgi:hypothetical protein
MLHSAIHSAYQIKRAKLEQVYVDLLKVDVEVLGMMDRCEIRVSDPAKISDYHPDKYTVRFLDSAKVTRTFPFPVTKQINARKLEVIVGGKPKYIRVGGESARPFFDGIIETETNGIKESFDLETLGPLREIIMPSRFLWKHDDVYLCRLQPHGMYFVCYDGYVKSVERKWLNVFAKQKSRQAYIGRGCDASFKCNQEIGTQFIIGRKTYSKRYLLEISLGGVVTWRFRIAFRRELPLLLELKGRTLIWWEYETEGREMTCELFPREQELVKHAHLPDELERFVLDFLIPTF